MLSSKLIVFLTALAVASPIPSQADSHNLQARQDDPNAEWAGYNMVTQELSENGQCRSFTGATTLDKTEPCRPYCERIGQPGGEMGCFAEFPLKPGTTEPADPSIMMNAPNGDEFTFGECVCSTEIKEDLGALLGEALIELGQGACHAWYQGLKYSVTIIGTAPPAGAAAAGIQTLATLVGRLNTLDSLVGSNQMKTFVEQQCGEQPWGDIDFAKAYEYLKTQG